MRVVPALLIFALGQDMMWDAQAQQPNPACRLACRADLTPPTATLHHCLSDCAAGRPITRDGPGEARPAGMPSAAIGRPLSDLPAPGTMRATVTGTMPPAQPVPPAPTPLALPVTGASYGAVYLATPPNMGFGMVVGLDDRLTAHRQAEIACRNSGASCAMAREFTLPCAAVAEGVRRVPGALFMTSDPKTYRVRAITHAVAEIAAEAERDALQTCAQRELGKLTCRIVQSRCAAR